jgi:hypothetical protein
MKVTSIAVLTLILASGTLALAGNNPDTKVAVHVRPHDAGPGCDYGTINSCHDLVMTEPGASFDAFPVFFDIAEFMGCEYGMWWPEWTYSAAFSNCADQVIGDIAWPYDGASHTWSTCQTGTWVCVPSYIWLYADGPGMVCVIQHPVNGEPKVFDCEEGWDEALETFCAGVNGYVGDDPCPPVEASPDTWGGIKDRFE